jgi:hypothetical protein
VQHVVQIDFDQGKIRFLRKIPEDAGEQFEIISLRKRPRLCAVTVRAQCCSEPAAEFSVELECPDAIYLRSAAFHGLLKKGELRWPHIESTFDTSEAPISFVGTAKTFKLGRFETNDVRAVAHLDNVIGLGYLSRFVVTFDFPNGAMYLRPGKQFERVDDYDGSGLHATMTDKALRVVFCTPKGPAHRAGVTREDTIVEINGQPVNRKNQAEFRRRIREPGAKLQVHFKRDGEDHHVELELPAIPRGDPGDADPTQGDFSHDDIPDYPPRRAPSALEEIGHRNEPQNAGHNGPLKKRVAAERRMMAGGA